MRKRTALVVTEDRQLRALIVESLRHSGLVDLDTDRKPDFVCLGCCERISLRDLETIKKLRGSNPVPVVLMTSRGSEDLAVQALRNGIREYLKIPFTPRELESVLAAFYPPRPQTGLKEGERFVGGSRPVREIKAYLEKLAGTNSNVLITGETGTGKELIAELIHKNSSRANRPLVCINCAAIPDSLLESEFFGYERGAFTGAHVSHDGKLKFADGGTLFLDEIGDMSPYAQAKILRVIVSCNFEARTRKAIVYKSAAALPRSIFPNCARCSHRLRSGRYS